FAGQPLELPHRRRWHTSASRARPLDRSRSLYWHNCSPVGRFVLGCPRFSTRRLPCSIQRQSARSSRGTGTRNPESQSPPARGFLWEVDKNAHEYKQIGPSFRVPFCNI